MCTFFLYLFLTFLSDFIIVTINLIQLLAAILIWVNYLSIKDSSTKKLGVLIFADYFKLHSPSKGLWNFERIFAFIRLPIHIHTFNTKNGNLLFSCTDKWTETQCVGAQNSLLILKAHSSVQDDVMSFHGDHLNFQQAVSCHKVWVCMKSGGEKSRKFRNSWNRLQSISQNSSSLQRFLGSRPHKSWPHKDWTEKDRNPRGLA